MIFFSFLKIRKRILVNNLIIISLVLSLILSGFFGMLIFEFTDQKTPIIPESNFFDYQMKVKAPKSNIMAFFKDASNSLMQVLNTELGGDINMDEFYSYGGYINSSELGFGNDRIEIQLIFMNISENINNIQLEHYNDFFLLNLEEFGVFSHFNNTNLEIYPNRKDDLEPTQSNSSFNLNIREQITLDDLNENQREYFTRNIESLILISSLEKFHIVSEELSLNWAPNLKGLLLVKFGIQIKKRILFSIRGRILWNNFKQKIEESYLRNSILIMHQDDQMTQNTIESDKNILFTFGYKILLFLLFIIIGIELLRNIIKKQQELVKKNEDLMLNTGLLLKKLIFFHLVEKTIIFSIGSIMSFIIVIFFYRMNWPSSFSTQDFIYLASSPNLEILLLLLFLFLLLIYFFDLKELLKEHYNEIDTRNLINLIIQFITKIFSSNSAKFSIFGIIVSVFILLLIIQFDLFLSIVFVGIICFLIIIWFFPEIIEKMHIQIFIFGLVGKIGHIPEEYAKLQRKLYYKHFNSIIKLIFFLVFISGSFLGAIIGIAGAYQEIQEFNYGGNITISTYSNFNKTLLEELGNINGVSAVGYAGSVESTKLIDENLIFQQKYDIIGLGTNNDNFRYFVTYKDNIELSLQIPDFFAEINNSNNIIVSTKLFNDRGLTINDKMKVWINEINKSNLFSYNLTIKGYVKRFPAFIGRLYPIKMHQVENDEKELIIGSYKLLEELVVYRNNTIRTSYYLRVTGNITAIAEEIESQLNIIPFIVPHEDDSFSSITEVPVRIFCIGAIIIMILIVISSSFSLSERIKPTVFFLKAHGIENKERRLAFFSLYICLSLLILFDVLLISSFLIWIDNYFANISLNEISSIILIGIIPIFFSYLIFTLLIFNIEVESMKIENDFKKQGISMLFG